MINELNKKIVENSGLVWGMAFLGLFVLTLSPLPSWISIGLFWAVHPYICYVLAKSKNRNAFLWAFLGAWFWWFAILILARLTPNHD